MKELATTCYNVVDEKFEFLTGNRDVIPSHVEGIKKAILNGAYMPAILVDANTNYIIDGQHRYCAYEKLWEEGHKIKMLVEYYNSTNAFKDAIDFNNTAIPWTLYVYLNAYKTAGIKEYVEFMDWVDSIKDKIICTSEKRIPYQALLYICGVKTTSNLKAGLLKIETSDYKFANFIVNNFGKNPIVFKSTSSVKAFCKVFNSVYIDEEFINSFNTLCSKICEDLKLDFTTIKQWEEFFITLKRKI